MHRTPTEEHNRERSSTKISKQYFQSVDQKLNIDSRITPVHKTSRPEQPERPQNYVRHLEQTRLLLRDLRTRLQFDSEQS